MNKSWFQLLLASYIFAAFIGGCYVFYTHLYPFLLHIINADISTKMRIIGLCVVGLACALIISLLMASIQIFRTGNWSILKYLLYASIPSVNIYGYFAYAFYFMPYLYAIVGYKSIATELSVNTDFSLFPIMFGFNFRLFGSDDIIALGINIVPIIVIILLQKYYRKA